LSTIPAAGAAAFSEKIEEKARDARAFAWSASRHDTFATCPRKYYYSYYGILEDPEVQRLKQLSALALWAGSVVHETIEDFLRTSDEIPEPAVQEALIRSVVHERMLKEWKQSEGGTEGFRLFEHEYTQPIEQEDKKILVGIVMRSLPLPEKGAIVSGFSRDLWPWLADGRLQPVVDSEFPLSEVQAAHERMEKNLNVGKIVLKVR